MQTEMLIKLKVEYQGGTFSACRGEVIALPRICAKGMIDQGHAEEIAHPVAAGLTCVRTNVGYQGPGRSFEAGARLFLPKSEAQQLIASGFAEKTPWRGAE